MSVAGNAGSRRDSSRWRNRLRIALALLVGVGLIALGDALRGPGPSATAEAARPDLRPWGLLGCYALETEPWDAAADRFSEPIEAAEALPRHVMLLPDSLDQWGRELGTYRAVPLGEGRSEELRNGMRWFVRADTLWLVWSAGRVRGGVALFAVADTFQGRVRASSAGRAGDLTARAAAWRVNCATRRRELPGTRPRR